MYTCVGANHYLENGLISKKLKLGVEIQKSRLLWVMKLPMLKLDFEWRFACELKNKKSYVNIVASLTVKRFLV